MKEFLRKNQPPGYRFKSDIYIIGITYLYGVLYSMTRFFTSFNNHKSWLYEYVSSYKKVLIEDAEMPDFLYILDNSLYPILAFGFIMLCFTIVPRYLSYYRGSKSIYLMKRLPDRFEMHKRALTLPIICFAVFMITALILFFVFYAHYMRNTPPEALQPDQWRKIWSVLL